MAGVLVAPGGRAALVLAGRGPGQVRPLGADLVTHRIRAAAPEPGGLRLAFGEIGAPLVRGALEPGEAAAWMARLGVAGTAPAAAQAEEARAA